jgi:hypothetical protein
MIAPVGPYIDALYLGIRDFPTEKVYLIAAPEFLKEAMTARESLEKFKIPAEILQVHGNLWEETFEIIAKIKERAKDRELAINVATGDRDMRCAATSAAFVNGLKAISVIGSETMILPVLKFSYYNLLSDRKMDILRTLYVEKDGCASLEEMSNKMKMSLPLLSYHINGTMKTEGLKQLGLVETTEEKGRVKVTITTLGKLIVKGYVAPPSIPA